MMAARLVTAPIEAERLIAEVSGPDKGAVSIFLGTVREMNSGRKVNSLAYSAYAEMAKAELDRILAEAAVRFGVANAVVEHRLGALEIGDVSIGIAVSHAHRAPAMAAVTYAIEEIKTRVPVWKEENYADGTREWVDPTRMKASA
jgi:molybdopterin synthase catalytic subunit